MIQYNQRIGRRGWSLLSPFPRFSLFLPLLSQFRASHCCPGNVSRRKRSRFVLKAQKKETKSEQKHQISRTKTNKHSRRLFDGKIARLLELLSWAALAVPLISSDCCIRKESNLFFCYYYLVLEITLQTFFFFRLASPPTTFNLSVLFSRGFFVRKNYDGLPVERAYGHSSVNGGSPRSRTFGGLWWRREVSMNVTSKACVAYTVVRGICGKMAWQ